MAEPIGRSLPCGGSRAAGKAKRNNGGRDERQLTARGRELSSASARIEMCLAGNSEHLLAHLSKIPKTTAIPTFLPFYRPGRVLKTELLIFEKDLRTLGKHVDQHSCL